MTTPLKRLCIFFVLCTQVLFSQNQKIVDSLLKIAQNKNTADTLKIYAYNDLSYQYAPSNPKLAKDYVNKALQIGIKLKRKREMAGSYNCMGIIHYFQKEYDSAFINFEKAYQFNKEINYTRGQASALHQMGAVLNLQDKYQEAIQNFQQSGEMLLATRDTIPYAASQENIGVSYMRVGNVQKATEYFIKAIKINEQKNNLAGIGRGYLQLSNGLIKRKEYDKALQYLNEALPKIQVEGNKQYVGSILNNIGSCYRGLGQYDKALDYHQQALFYKQASGNKKIIARTQSFIGATYLKKGAYDRALTILNQALQNFPEKGNDKEKVFTYNTIANTYLRLSKIARAKEYANKALGTAKKISHLEGEKESNYILANIAEKEGRTKQALALYKDFEQLKDSLITIQNQKRAQELQTIYETDKKEKQILTQQSEIKLLEQEAKTNNLQRILLAVGLSLSLIILGLGIYALRLKVKRSTLEKEKVQAELDFKQKELTTHALHIAKKNELLEAIKQKATDLRNSENNQNGYKQLIQTINFDLNDDNHWDNFARYFEDVHKDFNSKVKQKFPDLTTNELRLMALLKMNLSSKEIANILNISLEGVKKARYRLRKKLDIATEESLQDTILKI